MQADGDWRLTNQEQYLKDTVLSFRRYRRPRTDWNHDHCEFCWAKFAEENEPDTLHEGYSSADGYRWICPRCFHDFKDQFRWVLAEPP